ncbi:MAG: pectate lyase [Paludibacter sp.]|jgi:pectate lyase|nr:pectate lyase [Paludibacter sp.]
MKHIFFLIFLAAAVSLAAQRPQAFPGAEGFGKYASGGRMGTVYHVTNLNDSGEGSLRDAVSKPRRIVIFDVGGVIKLSSPLHFSENLTIAGQTAPGEGITVYGQSISFTNANNLICRYIRFRLGDNGAKGADAVSIGNGFNMIFDHVSVSWGKDENFSISSMAVVGGPTSITLQNSIIGQGLADHSMGGLVQSDGGVTLYRNLYIDNRSRNVKAKGVQQFINNVVYNWTAGAYILGDSEFTSFANITDNYFIKGNTKSAKPFTRGNHRFSLYAADNYYDDNLNGVLDGHLLTQEDHDKNTWNEKPFDFPAIPKQSAQDAYVWIVKNAGCTFPARDAVDAYMIDELKSAGTNCKLIETESEMPVKVNLEKTWKTTIIDSDRDGMPDDWEIAHGLDPKDPKDARPFGLSLQYTNIELYLNSIVAE